MGSQVSGAGTAVVHQTAPRSENQIPRRTGGFLSPVFGDVSQEFDVGQKSEAHSAASSRGQPPAASQRPQITHHSALLGHQTPPKRNPDRHRGTATGSFQIDFLRHFSGYGVRSV